MSKRRVDRKKSDYLFNPNGRKIAGPYLYIENDLHWAGAQACRYTGLNGLIGYLDTAGNEITSPKYTRATEMLYGTALVSEKGTGIYYINSIGERITTDYEDGTPFGYRGNFAKVLKDNGWAIISKDNTVVFSGADSIEELPEFSTPSSAVKNGHALLFILRLSPKYDCSIIKEFDEFVDISYVHKGLFAVVMNDEDLYGVVNYKGDEIFECEYSSVEFEMIDKEDQQSQNNVRFILHNTDGTYSIKEVSVI